MNYIFLISPMRDTFASASSSPLTLMICCEEKTVWMSLLHSFLWCPITSSISGANILLDDMFLNNATAPNDPEYFSIIKPTSCTIFLVYWISLYMFRTIFPSIIRSSRLYTQHQVYVIQISWLLASGHEMELQFHLVPASKQSSNLYDIYLMLCVQSWTPDDRQKDRPKHVEWYSINSKNCASSWFYYRNISRCMNIRSGIILSDIIVNWCVNFVLCRIIKRTRAFTRVTHKFL
jgi:hypothetical protein